MIIYEEIFNEFQTQKVKYVIVGGLAVNLLGSLRSTADLDLLVELSNKNLAKIVAILKKRGYRVKQPVDPMGIADKKIREDWIKNKHMKAFNFYKGERFWDEVDIIIDSPVTYAAARKNAILVSVGHLKLPVISIDDLIKMKRRANRDVDRLDIKQLLDIKKMRGQR